MNHCIWCQRIITRSEEYVTITNNKNVDTLIVHKDSCFDKLSEYITEEIELSEIETKQITIN